jgi:AraC-like DNA-binding protein
VGYREIAPPPEIRSHVACLWLRTGPAPRVLPDGCADLVWTGTEAVVAGPATRSVRPSVAPDAVKLGVRFRVGAAGVALGLPAVEVIDRAPTLGELWRNGDEVTERIAEASDARARLGVLVAAVARRISRGPSPDPLVRAAVLDVAVPRTRVGSLGERVGLSERQLRRRFAEAVGYAPKTLARVLRLQRFLELARRDGDDLARLAAEVGYADQPHLTRDCLELTSLPAAALLSSGAVPAGERLSSAGRRPHR